jgi:hypothetical protein
MAARAPRTIRCARRGSRRAADLAARAVACLAAAGCAMFSPLPDTRTPADRAREIFPLCKGVREQEMAPLLSARGIDAVQAAYANVPSGVGALEKRLRGARLQLRPTPGMSSEALTRSLECHQARFALGQLTPGPDDPFVLPGAWLDLDASSARDSFVVVVSADEADDARQVLARARRFVASAGTTSEPGPAPSAAASAATSGALAAPYATP